MQFCTKLCDAPILYVAIFGSKSNCYILTRFCRIDFIISQVHAIWSGNWKRLVVTCLVAIIIKDNFFQIWKIIQYQLFRVNRYSQDTFFSIFRFYIYLNWRCSKIKSQHIYILEIFITDGYANTCRHCFEIAAIEIK